MKKTIQFASRTFLILMGIGLYYFEFIDKDHNNQQAQSGINSEIQNEVSVIQSPDAELNFPPEKIGENYAYVNQERISNTDMSQLNYKIDKSEIEEEINLRKINQQRQPASEKETK